MVSGQFKLMVEKKSFQISFFIMLLFSLLFPVLYCLSTYVQGNDVSWLPSKEYAFIFNYHCKFAQFTVYIIPLIAYLPFSLSYVKDKKLGCNLLLISKSGVKSYYYSKYICSFIGGFIVLFIPAMMNIIMNQMFLYNTKQDLLRNGFYCMIYEDYINYDENIVVNPGFFMFRLFFTHPQVYNAFTAICMALLGGTLSVVSFAVSLLLPEKYSYLSFLPSVLLLIIGKKYYEMYQAGVISTFVLNLSLDDYGLTCSPAGKSYLFFLVSLMVLNIVSFIVVRKFSLSDQV